MKIYSTLISIAIAFMLLSSQCSPAKEKSNDVETIEPKETNNKTLIFSQEQEALFAATAVKVVFPASGCESCLRSMEKVVLERETDYITPVITNVNSMKEVSQFYSSELIEKSVIDTLGVYLNVIQPDPSLPWLMLFEGNENTRNIAITSKNQHDLISLLVIKTILKKAKQEQVAK